MHAIFNIIINKQDSIVITSKVWSQDIYTVNIV